MFVPRIYCRNNVEKFFRRATELSGDCDVSTGVRTIGCKGKEADAPPNFALGLVGNVLITRTGFTPAKRIGEYEGVRMKDNLRESLSTLMDNEGDELEVRRVLKGLGDSPDAAESWRRYHLARSLMQRDREIDVSSDLSAGIMARIKNEPLPQSSATSKQARRYGSFSFAGSAAVAAAVSLMVITGVQFYNGFDATGPADMASRAADNAENVPASSSLPMASLGSPVSLPSLQAPMLLGEGLMPVGAGSGSAPLFMAPNQRQSQRADLEQARLLQSYLERHADGAAYRSGEAWMPLLRASAQESLSTR